MRMNFKIACYYSNFHQLKTYSLFFRNIANLNKEKEKIEQKIKGRRKKRGWGKVPEPSPKLVGE